MKSKRLIVGLAVASVLIAGGIAWTEIAHRPRDLAISVEGMTCEGCALSVRESIEKLPGVSDVSVSVEKGEATFTLDGWSETTPQDIRMAIRESGYDVRD